MVSAAFAFANCMRNHGVSNFPDPQVSGSANQQVIRMIAPGAIVHSHLFAAAQKACQGILPSPQNVSPAQIAAQQHAREQDLLAFARCLRSHGVSHFPDPTSQGRFTLAMVQAAGVDLHAPAVLPAARACIGVARGAITPADVERAINSAP